MILKGNFVFVSGRTKEGSNGKVYGTANMDCDGVIDSVSANPSLLEKMQKYHEYVGTFEMFNYKGQRILTLVGADLVK